MRTKIVCLLAILCTSIVLNAQINVGDASDPTLMNKGGSFDKKDVEAFKTTTTICFLQNKDKAKIADYQIAASQVWTFNKIEFATVNDLPKYEGKPGYSFITITGLVDYKGNASSTSSYFLKFWYPYEKKNGKMDEKVIARVDLYLDPGSDGEIVYGKGKKDEKTAYMVSDQATYYNLSPGFMKCYLSVINKYLNDKKKLYRFAEEEDKMLLKKLETDTLFLPDYIKLGNGMATGKMRDEKELLEKYEYKYSFIANDALSQKILSAQKNTFVFSYIYFSSQKFYTIYEAQKGTIVYSAYESRSMNGLNDGDFKKLSKNIK